MSTIRNYFPLNHNAGLEDRKEFDRKHEVTGAGERQLEYCRLADYSHNSIPMHEFCRDYVYDNEEDMYRLIVDSLKAEFSLFGPDDRALGERFRKLVTESFDDHTVGMD